MLKIAQKRRLRDRFPAPAVQVEAQARHFGPGRVRRLQAAADSLRDALPGYRETRIGEATALAAAMDGRARRRRKFEAEFGGGGDRGPRAFTGSANAAELVQQVNECRADDELGRLIAEASDRALFDRVRFGRR